MAGAGQIPPTVEEQRGEHALARAQLFSSIESRIPTQETRPSTIKVALPTSIYVPG